MILYTVPTLVKRIIIMVAYYEDSKIDFHILAFIPHRYVFFKVYFVDIKTCKAKKAKTGKITLRYPIL